MTDSRLIASSAFVLSLVLGIAISPDAGAQAPGVIVSDTFTGANGTPLSSHAPDVGPSGSAWTTSSSAVTLSNQRAATSTRMFATATIDAGTADGTVSADWRSAAWGGSGGIVFRATDANNYWLAYYGDPTCELDKVTNGVARRVTSVDTSDDLTQPPMTGHFSVALAGTSIRFSCEGYVLQTTDPFNVTGTRHGLQWYGGDGTATFDSFQVTGARPPTVASIVVTPGPTTVLFKGSQTLSAQAYDAGGAPMSGVSVGWSSSNPAAVTVTALTATTASVSSVGPGTSTITATPVRGASGAATVTVDPGAFLVFDDFTGPNGIALIAHPPLLSQIGSTWQTSGGVVTVNTQRAAAAGSAVALIDAGAADGTVSADWSSGAWGASGGLVFRATDANNYWLAYYSDPTCELDKVINGVARRVTSVETADDLTQPPMTGHFSVSFAGTSIRFFCEGYVLQTTDAFNVTATRDGVQWYAGDGTATFDNFQVTGGLPPGPSRVAVTPGPATVLFKGSRTLTAQGFDATNTPMTNVAFTWTSSNPGAVTVTASTSNTAVISGVGPGSAIVTAAPTRGSSGTATVTVDPGTYLVYDDFAAVNGAPLNGRPPLVSQIGAAWITGGGAVTVNSQRATAVGSATALIDAGAADGTVSVDWSSRASGGIGEIIFRASDAGNLWLAARGDPQCWLGKYVNGHWITVQSISTADTLNQPPLSDSLAVSVAGANITFTCGGAVLKATDPFNATATKYGLKWDAGDGTATFDNFSITGTQPPTVASVLVTPGSTAVAFGASTTLTAQAYNAGGSALPNVSVAWATSNPTAVRVTPLTGTTAAISGDATGTATISATPVRGASGTATATVTPGPSIVYDRFAGDDGTALTAHVPNVDQIGGGWMVTRAPALALAGGRVGLSSGAADVDAFINAGTPDAAVAVSWRAGESPAGGANYGALIFRRSDARNYFLLESWNGRVALERVMNGTLTTLWSDEADVDPGETHGLQAILSGPSIEVQWDDGVLLRHVIDTFNLSATQYGFRLSPYWDPHATYDDFSVTGTLPLVPDHVAIAAGPLTMLFSTSRQLSAQAFDASNAVIPGVAFSWTTSNPMIARVGSISPTLAGVVATGTGTATITATPSRGPSATTAVSVTPGKYIVYDSFTDADGTPLTAHRPEVHAVENPWTVTGAPVPSIVGGNATRPATGTGDVSVVIDAATPDAAVGVSWTAGASPAGGANYGSLIFRQSDARNYFSLEYWSGRVSLYRVVNGRFTRLWSDEASVDPGETHGFSAILAGPHIEVMWDNGVLVRSVTDTFNISATQYGFVLSGWDTAATYDSFSLTGTLPPSIPALAASATTLSLAPFDTREVIAQATDGSGHPVPGAVVQWRSSNPVVATATIDSATAAKVEALAVGTTVLTAHAPIGPAADVTIPVTVSVCVDPPAVSSASFDWLGETKSFVVTAPGTCEWTAWSRAPWIAVVGGASGNGPRTVTYTVDANDGIPRVGTLVIGGRVLTVSQDSQPCTYQMWPESAHWGADGGTGGFQVWASSGCPWQAMVTEPAGFLSATGSGGASGFVTYSLDPNPYAYTRGNTIHIGTAIFTVTQENNSVPGGNLDSDGTPPLSSCAMRFRPNPLEVSLGGGSGQFAVTVDPQCPWTLTPDLPWISLAPIAGIGSGPVAYSVGGSTAPRATTIRAGNDWLTVNQGFASGSSADLLEGNEVLHPGEFRTSANGRYRLNYQEDGNLVLYRLDTGRAIWANHERAVGGAVVMQSDGNLVLYDSAGVPVWSTQTAAHPGARLQVQDDANVVISSAEGEPLWDTATGMVGEPQPDRLIPGEVLFPGEFRTSPNGAYRLNYQEEDGHFVLYALPDGTALWGNYTYAPDGSIVMQLDGNLVMNDRDGVGVWATWTGGHPGAHLQVQDDGNVVIYGADGVPLWDTDTAQAPRCSVHVAPAAITAQALGGQAIAPVTVTTGTGCTWTATSDGIWARPTVAASSGDGLETFDVDPNTGAASRVAHVRIGDTDIALTQLVPGAGPDVVTYYHTDAIGSVRMTTDAAGHVLARYDYLPFGKIWNAPADPDRREFAGKERDSETGLDYFGARYLSELSGRFTTVDPGLDVEKSLANPQLWNRYVYAVNNPLRFVDPDGRQVILATPAGYTPADAKRNELWRDWIAQQLSPAPTIARGVDWLASLLWPATAQEQSRSLTLDFVGIAAGFEVPEAGLRTLRVIGHYTDGYLEMGEKLRAKYLDIPKEFFEKMSREELMKANTRFLNRAIQIEAPFRLATPRTQIRRASQLEWEVNYLLDHGYRWLDDYNLVR